MALRILVVDDSIIFRKAITDAISGIPDTEIVGTAANGRIALSRIKTLKPDMLTLDLEMPEMNGLELLEAIRNEGLAVGAVLLSCLSVRGGDLTMKGLELGAFDYITKPEGATPAQNTLTIRRALEPIFKAFQRQKEVRGILRGRPGTAPVPLLKSSITATAPAATLAARPLGKRSEAIAIGISTGGPKALTDVLIALPGNMGVPLFIVQHMPAFFTASLANNLNTRCPYRVKEAENGESVVANTAYIAPGGKQMKVALASDGTGKIIRITDDPPENNCRPSVDHLFRSIAHHYMGRATGVIMTGMGNDGVVGLKLMKRNGAVIIAQNEATCVVYGMPKAAVDAGVVDVVVPLDRIAVEIMRTLGTA
jgi:two-component system, chemotaxis family, protein-glutamate methylesterase/glutaminase